MPLTHREERLRRLLRSVPVVVLALAAFALERPWLIAAALAWGLGVIVVARVHARALNARLKADGFDVPPPSKQHGSWTFYFTAPGGFMIEVLA